VLEIRLARELSGPALCPPTPGAPITGLREDTDYVFGCTGRLPGSRLYVDDVELAPGPDGSYRWRPSFYAGRVLAELLSPEGVRQSLWLDVGPADSKSGDQCFADMVGQIRAFDPALLGGASAATMAFGRDGRTGLYSDDVLLSRLREHGPSFVDAVVAIARAPHRALSADLQMLPLSRVRRLHPSALRDRRVAAMCSGTLGSDVDSESIQLRSLTSTPTFDTPANRALVALLHRILATSLRLYRTVADEGLGANFEEQAVRVERRLLDLSALETRIRVLLSSPPFSEVRTGGTTAAGLTQVAAQPAYSRAYRLGCMALSTSVEGDDEADALHVNHSWGIYETWCYLAVVEVLGRLIDAGAEEFKPAAVSAQLAHRLPLKDGATVETYFQALFPSEAPSAKRSGWSISRERRPDILLVLRHPSGIRSMVLDAKWRSGRDNVLQAMESAHIYHDALRLDSTVPSPCVLLLPGPAAVPSLGSPDYLASHGVGALSDVTVGQPGMETLAHLLTDWLGLDRPSPGGK
jgi:hypothetical protein